MAVALVLLLSLLIGSLVWLLVYPWNDGRPDFVRVESVLAGSGMAGDTTLRWTDRVLAVLRITPNPDTRLARDLTLSGYPVSLAELYVYKALGVIGGLTFAGLMYADGDSLIALVACVAALAAWGLPDSRITAEAKRIRREITHRLPAMLQSLAMMTEAGMNLHPALNAYCQQDDTALGAELGRMTDEVELGAPLAEALMRMASRCQVDDLYRTVTALVQTSERGAAGLTETCRHLAAEAWARRKDTARELGHQAATKMFLPMVLLILPVVFLFMIGPAIFSLMTNF
ncbi:MAG TPA: type II secretion system F family protein [Symbiobacteriaceae bacterium]|jgi:tight adherence protein C